MMQDLPKGISPMMLTRERIYGLWEIVSKYDSLFITDELRSLEAFTRNFLDPETQIFDVEGRGYIILKHIKEGVRAEFHATFLDHRLSARKELLREFLVWLFLEFGLERLETYVAGYAKAVKRFLVGIGFTHEGTLRNWAKRREGFVNVEIYGILREEVGVWATNPHI